MKTQLKLVYVATGPSYYAEALISADSVISVHPSASIIIYGDKEYIPSRNVEFRKLANPTFSFRDKILALKDIEHSRFIFLDSDTFVIGSLEPLSEMLERFDFAASICEVRITPKLSRYNSANFFYNDVPASFVEFNSGVMAMRKSVELNLFLFDWLRLYDQECSVWSSNVPDQPSLRRALYRSSLNVGALPPEFNFRMPFFGYFEADVRILHGRRTAKQFSAFAEYVNKPGPRIYIPRLGLIRQQSGFISGLLSIRNIVRLAWSRMW